MTEMRERLNPAHAVSLTLVKAWLDLRGFVH